jgi:hypothetical protein
LSEAVEEEPDIESDAELSEDTENEQVDCYEDGLSRFHKAKFGISSSNNTTNTVLNILNSSDFAATLDRAKLTDQKATFLVGAIAVAANEERHTTYLFVIFNLKFYFIVSDRFYCYHKK